MKMILPNLVPLLLFGFGGIMRVSAKANCSCYVFFALAQKDWNDSQRQCSAGNGILVSMETEKEWQFVNQKVQERDFRTNEWFIGLIKHKGSWGWLSGESLKIDKLQTIDRAPNVAKECAVIAKHFPNGNRGLFKDVDCASKNQFICEYDSDQAMCQMVKQNYSFCQNNAPKYEASDPVHFGNYTDDRLRSPTGHVNIAKVTATTKAKPQSSSKLGLIIFVVIFGVILFVCTLFFLYVFCWCNYLPGYQGDGKDHYKALYHSNTSDSSPISSGSHNQTHRIITESFHTESVDLIDQNWPINDDPNEPHDTDVQSECLDEKKNPVIYAEVNKLLVKPPVLDSPQGNAGRVNFEDIELQELTEKANSENLTNQTSELEEPEKRVKPIKPVKPVRPVKPLRHKKDAVIYANIQSIHENSSSRLRSNTADVTFLHDDHSVAKETGTSLRRQTWNVRSRDHDVTESKSSATWYIPDEEKKENTDQDEHDPPVAKNVIYATVDKSKKTKRIATSSTSDDK